MTTDNGLLFAYLLDGKGGGKKITPLDVHTITNQKKTVWLHVDLSAPDTVEWLESFPGLDPHALDILTEDEVRSRTIIHNNYLYVCLRSMNLNQNQDEEDMVSIRVLIQNNLIISSRKRELRILTDICQEIEMGEGPTCPIELLSAFLTQINTVISNHINELEDSVDEAEENYLVSLSEVNRDEISNLRKKILILKRHLSPQKEALKLLYASNSKLLANDKHLFQDHLDTHLRLLDTLDLTRERCSLLQERISNKLSEQLNKKMYLFSLITAVFLPISSIASIFGMNLGGIPGSDNIWGFSIACVSLFGTSGALIIYLKLKKWF